MAAKNVADPIPLIKAVDVIKTFATTGPTKFDQTVEIHMRLGVDSKQADQIIRGSVVLPHGIGRTQRVVVFAKGDMAAAKAAYTANITIIDEPPPYMWSGRDAFDTWLADLGKDSKAAGRTAESLVIGRTMRAETSRDTAYVIAAAVYSFTKGGVAMVEAGRMTFALKRQAGGWKIAGWTWTGPRPRPATAA